MPTAGIDTEPYCAGLDQTRTLTGNVDRSGTGCEIRKFSEMFARAAHCDVTPRRRPIRLAGYASRETPVATVLDPIEIAALLLESNSRRCLILGFDLMIVGAELAELIQARLGQLGFRRDEVMMLASHTHCAPATDSACARLGAPDIQFINDAAEATETLVRRMLRDEPREVSLEVFRGELDHAINRRRYWPFPTWDRTQGLQWASVTFSPYPAGPRDEQATVILIRKVDDGAALAAFSHYACHPTSVVPSDVISADYPGAIRGLLRRHFGEISCLFAPGFCGDITPRLVPSVQRRSLPESFAALRRMVIAGYMVPTVSPADSVAWRDSLIAGLGAIIAAGPVSMLRLDRLRLGSSAIPLSRFFTGTTPAKELTVQILRLGDELEMIALSAEPTIEWQHILDEATPPPSQGIRLYTGYLGAVFGYLPTAKQATEGGYEVNGFQSLFGMSGRFESSKIVPAVADCVRSAIDDLEHTSHSAASFAGAG